MKIWRIAAVGVIVLGLTAAPGSAQLWSNPKVAEKLGLTDEQVEQLGNTALEQRKNGIELNSRMQIVQLELGQLWKADTLDEGAILGKVKELAKLRQEQMVAQAGHRLALSKVLTPEQREKVRKAIAQRRPRAMARRGRAAQGRAAQGRGTQGRGMQGRGTQGRGMQGRGRGPAGPGQGPGQGLGQGLGPCGPSGPAWGPRASQPGQPPRFRQGQRRGWGRFPGPAPGQGPREGRGRQQWGALDAGQEPFENDLLALDEEFTPLFCEEALNADE